MQKIVDRIHGIGNQVSFTRLTVAPPQLEKKDLVAQAFQLPVEHICNTGQECPLNPQTGKSALHPQPSGRSSLGVIFTGRGSNPPINNQNLFLTLSFPTL